MQGSRHGTKAPRDGVEGVRRQGRRAQRREAGTLKRMR